jgi:hypothetical protein
MIEGVVTCGGVDLYICVRFLYVLSFLHIATSGYKRQYLEAPFKIVLQKEQEQKSISSYIILGVSNRNWNRALYIVPIYVSSSFCFFDTPYSAYYIGENGILSHIVCCNACFYPNLL